MSRVAVTMADDAQQTGEVSWPIVIYAFDSNNSCAAVQTVTSATSTPTNVTLAPGTYKLYAIGGLDSDKYTVPSQDAATPTTTIALKDGATEHADIMTAQSGDITLTAGQTSSQTLSLSRNVAMITTVTIDNVPSDVQSVNVTISPLYDAINIDGSFTNRTSVSKTISLAKSATDNTWSCEANAYIFPQGSSTEITYQFVTATATREFKQSTTQIAANHKIAIEAKYKQQPTTSTLACTLSGAQWGEDATVSNEIDEAQMTISGGTDTTKPDDSQTSTTTEPTADCTATGTAPALGAKYGTKMSTYVIKRQVYGDNTYVTLVYTWDQGKIATTTLTDQEEIKSAVDAKLSTLNKSSYNNVNKWRLPTIEELQYVADNYTQLQKATGVTGLMEKATDSYCYYCTKADGTVTAYTFKSNKEVTPDTKTAYSKIDAFVVVKYSN